jgi:hypothetical protein
MPDDTGTPPGEKDDLAPYRLVAPGWYRDRENPSMARYWDGTNLSNERRPVATSSERPAISVSGKTIRPSGSRQQSAQDGRSDHTGDPSTSEPSGGVSQSWIKKPGYYVSGVIFLILVIVGIAYRESESRVTKSSKGRASVTTLTSRPTRRAAPSTPSSSPSTSPSTSPSMSAPSTTVAPDVALPPVIDNCEATMSNPRPGISGDDTVSIMSNIPNAPVTITQHYKTTTSTDSGTTDGTGSASITFNMAYPAIGYSVQIDVNIGDGESTCSTSFTPE